MKTFRTILAAALLACLCCSLSLSAQQSNSASSAGSKKITIIKRTVEADGTETTETIVKKGKAAETFDVDKYVQDNKSDKTQVEVRVDDANEDNNYNYNYNWNHSKGNGIAIAGCEDKGAFLGVMQDSDEDEDQPGIVVKVVKCSAAAKAGLKTNDVILKLNDTPTNDWSALTKVINSAKPGDKLSIAYARKGKEAVTEATLTTHSEAKCSPEESKRGFLGVNEMDNDDDHGKTSGAKVQVIGKSAAEKAGLKEGDMILKLNDTEVSNWEDLSDFMADTKPGDNVNITYQRDGKQNTTQATLGEQKDWDWSNWNLGNLDWDKFNIDVRQKDACLGVYSEAYSEGEQQGTKIDDFTEESAAREVELAKGDVITAVNGNRVKNHDELWTEIAKYKPGEKVKVEYLRDAKFLTVEATLKACRDNSNQIIINDTDDKGDSKSRQFYLYNWGRNDQDRMRERRVITIHKGEGDTEKAAQSNQPAQDRSLKLEAFKAYPNPTQGQITVEFKGEPVSTNVSLYDMSGRQLFREELNAFNGEYAQQFDLSEYAKGTILIQVTQKDKVFTEQIVVN